MILARKLQPVDCFKFIFLSHVADSNCRPAAARVWPRARLRAAGRRRAPPQLCGGPRARIHYKMLEYFGRLCVFRPEKSLLQLTIVSAQRRTVQLTTSTIFTISS